MTYKLKWLRLMVMGVLIPSCLRAETLVFETTSPYHHIRVVDRGPFRTLHFDNTNQSRISLKNPLQGHFEYTEYFHMPWLWNDQIKTVLIIGLGGATIQRAYQAYWPQATTETVELDPKVVEVARTYFEFKETDHMKVTIGDGRVHLRRSSKKYDLIILDAYTANRYGSYIPYSLVTREFFALARDHLTEQGLLAYNVIGSVTSPQKGIVGSIYKTLKTSFPQVTLFPAVTSYNVVMIASQVEQPVTQAQLTDKLEALTTSSRVLFPNFPTRLKQFRAAPPASVTQCDILTDDFAPVDGLLRTR